MSDLSGQIFKSMERGKVRPHGPWVLNDGEEDVGVCDKNLAALRINDCDKAAFIDCLDHGLGFIVAKTKLVQSCKVQAVYDSADKRAINGKNIKFTQGFRQLRLLFTTDDNR